MWSRSPGRLAHFLIGIGASIGFGGDFRDNGFTPWLAQLIEAHNQAASKPSEFLHAYLGAPLRPRDGGEFAFTDCRLGPGGSLEPEAKLAPPSSAS